MNSKKLWTYFLPILAGTWLLWLTIGYRWATLVNILVALPLAIFAWTLAYFVYDHLNFEKVDSRNKAVLITGCDSGFGFQLAKKLDALGFIVFAGLLFPEGEGAQRLTKECSPRIRIHRMDVTSQDEVEKVIEEIKQANIPLWAVVNNAGILHTCPFDWGNDIDLYKQTFEVNVFGMVRVTKNCMPLLRKFKGRVVNVASLAARITGPLMPHYFMAKHSVRVFSDAMRRELKDDIKVITIEPTFYRTPILNWENMKRTRDRILEQTPESIKEAYDESAIEIIESLDKVVEIAMRENTDEVVDTLVNAVTLAEPKLFYRCCGYGDIVLWISGLLPETILDGLMKTMSFNKHVVQLGKFYCSVFGQREVKTI